MSTVELFNVSDACFLGHENDLQKEAMEGSQHNHQNEHIKQHDIQIDMCFNHQHWIKNSFWKSIFYCIWKGWKIALVCFWWGLILFIISFLVPFAWRLQQFGTRICHFAWHLWHFGMFTFRFARYLVHLRHFNLSFCMGFATFWLQPLILHNIGYMLVLQTFMWFL